MKVGKVKALKEEKTQQPRMVMFKDIKTKKPMTNHTEINCKMLK